MTSQKGHILCVIYGTDLFGSERGTLQALKALQDEGYKITVLGSGRKPGGGQTGEAVREAGFNLELVPFGSHINKKWILVDANYRKILWRRIRKCHKRFREVMAQIKPTHLMICGTSPLPFLISAISLGHPPIIYRMGDAPVMESQLQPLLWQWLIRKSSVIVPISSYMESTLWKHARSLKNKHIQVIRNIAPQRVGSTCINRTQELIQTKRPFQLVYLGQITEKKGVGELVKALVALDNPTIGCWIVGGSEFSQPFQNQMKALCAASTTQTEIRWVGYQNDPRPYYQAADWHIAPSRYEEPLGNVVQEAQRESTPSITSNLGGLPELIEHKQTGWILKETSAQGIEQAIRHLITGPKWSQTAGTKANLKFQNYGSAEFQALWTNALKGA